MTIAEIDLEEIDARVEEDAQKLGQCRNILHYTLILMISHYLEDDGSIEETETSEHWLVYELYIWINKLKSKLKEIVKLEKEDYC